MKYDPKTSASYRKARRIDQPQEVINNLNADLAHAEAVLKWQEKRIKDLEAVITDDCHCSLEYADELINERNQQEQP